MVEATGEQLIISSEMVNDEVFDLGGKNKKNIAAFWNAFEKCRQTITETEIIDTTAAIEVLKAKTMDIAEQEAKEAAEIDAAMNLSKSNLYFCSEDLTCSSAFFRSVISIPLPSKQSFPS